MPTIRLEDRAVTLLEDQSWNGNIRQLRNIAEQLSILETNRNISVEKLREYLPNNERNLPALMNGRKAENDFSSEREILYKVLFDMKNDLNDLKKLTMKLMESDAQKVKEENKHLITKIYGSKSEVSDFEEELEDMATEKISLVSIAHPIGAKEDKYAFAEEIEEEETLSLQEKEMELIQKALERNHGKRKLAAKELGISERTLYRKIKLLEL